MTDTAEAAERVFDLGRAAGLVDVQPIGAVSKGPVSYTHLRAHETVLDLVCRLLLEKKKQTTTRSWTNSDSHREQTA